jgi:hypothetical protein
LVVQTFKKYRQTMDIKSFLKWDALGEVTCKETNFLKEIPAPRISTDAYCDLIDVVGSSGDRKRKSLPLIKRGAHQLPVIHPVSKKHGARKNRRVTTEQSSAGAHAAVGDRTCRANYQEIKQEK